MLAFAMAGAEPTASPPKDLEVKGAATVKYVLVPLDIVMNYLFRIQEKIQKVPHSIQLEWLITRDEGERALWVDSTETQVRLSVRSSRKSSPCARPCGSMGSRRHQPKHCPPLRQ